MSDAPELENGKTFQHFVIAALVGALIVFAIKVGTDRLLTPARPKLATATQSAPAVAQQSPVAEEEDGLARLEAEHKANLALADQKQKEREQSQADQAKREQKLQDALAARDVAAEQARKEAAWQHFYKKPKKCDNPSDNTVIVDCSNHYLREQARFEKLFADGKVQ